MRWRSREASGVILVWLWSNLSLENWETCMCNCLQGRRTWMFQIKPPGRKNDGTLHPSVIYSIQNNWGVHFSFFFFEDFIYLFMRHTETVTETGQREAGSMQEAQCGTRTWDLRKTWAEGRCSTTEPPRCPECLLFKSTQFLYNVTVSIKWYDPSDTWIQVMMLWHFHKLCLWWPWRIWVLPSSRVVLYWLLGGVYLSTGNDIGPPCPQTNTYLCLSLSLHSWGGFPMVSSLLEIHKHLQ